MRDGAGQASEQPAPAPAPAPALEAGPASPSPPSQPIPAATALGEEQQDAAHDRTAASDAETEPLPYSDDEGEHGNQATDMDPSAAPLIDDAAAAASALVGSSGAAPTKADRGEDNATSDSDLSDAPDDEARGDDDDDDDEEGNEDGDAEDEDEDEEDEDEDDGQEADGEEDAEGEEESDGGDTEEERGQQSESDDALEGEDDEDEDEDEEEEDGDEGGNRQAATADAVNASAARAGGRRARQERDNAAVLGQDHEDEEDAASSLAALAGGASQIDAGPPAEEAVDADAAGEEADTVADTLAAGSIDKATAAKTRKPSLLGAQLVMDPGSDGGTSRQPSAEPDEEGAEAGEASGDVDQDEAMKDAEAGEVGEEGEVSKPDQDEGAAEVVPETTAGTPVPEQPEQEDEQATDEAALRRTEAMDALTKIEIGFARLRDQLYVERTEEVSKEGQMILDGTHPELIHITALIEARRQHRLRMAELWFEEDQRYYAKMAAAEEREAWLTWRHNAADLRRESMDDISRKRRKLEREKRNIDAPRPVRRHQVFETEFIGDPELAGAAAEAAKADRVKGVSSRRRAAREARELAKLGSHVAMPDLRGLEDFDAWSDLERMGIYRPEMRMAGSQQQQGPPAPSVAPMPGGRMTPPPPPGHQGHHMGPPPTQVPMGPPPMPHSREAEMGYYGGAAAGPSWAGDGPPYHGNRPMSIAEMNAYGGGRPPMEMYPQGHYPEDAYAAEQAAMYQQHYGRPASPLPHPQHYEHHDAREPRGNGKVPPAHPHHHHGHIEQPYGPSHEENFNYAREHERERGFGHDHRHQTSHSHARTGSQSGMQQRNAPQYDDARGHHRRLSSDDYAGADSKAAMNGSDRYDRNKTTPRMHHAQEAGYDRERGEYGYDRRPLDESGTANGFSGDVHRPGHNRPASYAPESSEQRQRYLGEDPPRRHSQEDYLDRGDRDRRPPHALERASLPPPQELQQELLLKPTPAFGVPTDGNKDAKSGSFERARYGYDRAEVEANGGRPGAPERSVKAEGATR